MKSLQQELHLGSMLSLLALMLLLWWITTNVIEELSEQIILSRIQHDSDNILAHMLGEARELDTHHLTVGPIYHQPFSGHYFSLQIDDQAVIRSRSLWDTELATVALAIGETRVWHVMGPDNQPLLVWSSCYLKNQHQVLISVAEDMTPLYRTLAQFNQIFAVISMVSLLIIIAVQRYLVRRSLRPLRQVQAEIKQLGAGQVSNITEAVPLEILPLVQELNRVLEQLEQRLMRSRHAVGNMAHALKTPLNLVLRLAEQAPDIPVAQLSRELKCHTNSIHHLLERELKRARLSGSGAPGRRFVPTEEIPILVKLLQQIYQNKALHIDYQLPEITLPQVYDRDDLLELLGNLLDNACKWAKQQVQLSIDYQKLNNDDYQLSICVQDDGSGCSNEQMRHLTERGVRIDEGTPGHGLGLSIVNEIVTLYRGKMNIQIATSLGGLCVTVLLPGPAP